MITNCVLRAEDSNKLQSLKDIRAPLVDQLWDLQAQLNDLIEEYGDEFRGNEEKVLTLVREVKVLLERIDELSKDILQLIGATGNSEEREKEKEKQKEIKDDVSATLFNAKYTNKPIMEKHQYMFYLIHKREKMCV